MPEPGLGRTVLFIADQQVRDSTRQEIGAANSALQNSEWKAATVLGERQLKRCFIATD
jgi:hypothetical protein